MHILILISGGASGFNKSLTITNSCAYTVWSGLSTTSAGSAAELDITGLKLAPGESRALQVPWGWSGHLWGRTRCSSSTENSGCVTGDCASGFTCHDFEDSTAAVPPVTLVQFSMDASGGTADLYDISLVDGYNLPVSVEPRGLAPAPGGRCTLAACVLDLDRDCPAELRVTSAAGTGAAVACNSPCLAFGAPRYCCTGDHGSANTCMPSTYSELFKQACPHAITYAYDADAESVFTCRAGEDGICYTIMFCPPITRYIHTSYVSPMQYLSI